MSAAKSRGREPGVYKPREPGSLKEATALLIQACGGLDMASKLAIRVGRSTLARYSDPEEREAYIPADVIRALELNCADTDPNWPIVTRFLAAEQGCNLSCVKYDPTPKALAEDVAALSADFADLIGDAAKAIAEGGADIAPAERARLTRDIDKAVAVLFHMRARLAEGREG